MQEELLLLMLLERRLKSIGRTITMNLNAMDARKRRRRQVCLSMLKTYNAHIRLENYGEYWIDRYLDEDFYSLFRMTRSTFETLERVLIQDGRLNVNRVHGKEPLSSRKMLQCGLYYFSSQQTIRQIGDKFNLPDSSVLISIRRCCCALLKIMPEIIKWPNKTDVQQISEDFKNIAGFPNVIGVIDGSHIPCKVRTNIANEYLNRKMRHSIVLQAICTRQKVFTDICVGVPGRCHDARVFSLSAIGQEIAENGPLSLFYEEKYHILGDPAYANRTYCMVRFKKRANQPAVEKKYNVTHSRTRVVVEHAFGLLKGRWRRLEYVNAYSVDTVNDIICACCVLHNFCLFEQDFYDFVYQQENDDNEHEYNDILVNEVQARLLGAAKRNLIAAALP